MKNEKLIVLLLWGIFVCAFFCTVVLIISLPFGGDESGNQTGDRVADAAETRKIFKEAEESGKDAFYLSGEHIKTLYEITDELRNSSGYCVERIDGNCVWLIEADEMFRIILDYLGVKLNTQNRYKLDKK